MVRLGKGEVQQRTSRLLADIIGAIPFDPALDQAGALHGLLTTQSHIVIRFDVYRRYPTKLWMLTKKFNFDGYAYAIVDFLHEDDDNLDVGYSLALKREAWLVSKNVEADAVGFLMSARIQSELSGIFDRSIPNSLDVERKHYQDKLAETKKVTGCARASRNSILRRYLAFRKSTERGVIRAVRKKKSVSKMNIRSLACQKCPQFFTRARGKLRWQAEDDVGSRTFYG